MAEISKIQLLDDAELDRISMLRDCAIEGTRDIRISAIVRLVTRDTHRLVAEIRRLRREAEEMYKLP